MKESGPRVRVSVSHILPNSTRILEEIGASVKRARAIREKKMRVKNNENMRKTYEGYQAVLEFQHIRGKNPNCHKMKKDLSETHTEPQNTLG